MSSMPAQIVAPEALTSVVAAMRDGSRRIVMTNGCFDLLHVGHVRYLQSAAALGEVLLVAVNDDAGVRALKGEGRPIYPLAERMEMLAALRGVSVVTHFSGESVEPVVRLVRPDVLVKGGDYRPEGVVGHEFVRSYGGEVVVLEHVEGRSTTETVRRVRGGG